MLSLRCWNGRRTTAATSLKTFLARSLSQEAARPPVPPFTRESAALKVRAAEDAWNSRDPSRVALAYSVDSKWRNRSEFVTGRAEIEAFLTRKWATETQYRLIKELFAFDGNRIAVRFAYEWLDAEQQQWYRAYGNENWEFDAQGYMAKRFACINDLPIEESDRQFHWPQGRRPDNHPELSELGLQSARCILSRHSWIGQKYPRTEPPAAASEAETQTPTLEKPKKSVEEKRLHLEHQPPAFKPSSAMATIYSGAPSSSRFPFSAHTHYTSNADAAAQIQMHNLRYTGGYAMDNQSQMEASSPPSLAPPGATLGLLSKHQQLYESNAMYSSNQNVSMYMQSMMSKMYQPQHPHPPPMDMPQHHQQQYQQSEVLLVSPGVPTPLELSIYEVKQPTGFLHVTVGNQTVEFLDGVANMPQKR